MRAADLPSSNRTSASGRSSAAECRRLELSPGPHTSPSIRIFSRSRDRSTPWASICLSASTSSVLATAPSTVLKEYRSLHFGTASPPRLAVDVDEELVHLSMFG